MIEPSTRKVSEKVQEGGARKDKEQQGRGGGAELAGREHRHQVTIACRIPLDQDRQDSHQSHVRDAQTEPEPQLRRRSRRKCAEQRARHVRCLDRGVGEQEENVPAAPKEIASSWKIARIIRSPATADGAKDDGAAMAATLKSRPLGVNRPHETP